MAEAKGVQAYPLQWPAGWPRSTYRSKSQFKVTPDKARQELIWEVQRMGGTSIVISTNARMRADGKGPRADERPSDPGVAVYFIRKGKQMVFPCDRWPTIAENMQALHHTIEALRGIDRWGASEMMERAFSGFKALAAENPGPSWWDVLQLDAQASAAQIDEAYRKLAQVAHPDISTGSHEAMAALNAAREQGLAVAKGRG